VGGTQKTLSSVTTPDDVPAMLSAANAVEPTVDAAADSDTADTWPLLPADIMAVSAKLLATPRDRMTFSGTAVYRNNTPLHYITEKLFKVAYG